MLRIGNDLKTAIGSREITLVTFITLGLSPVLRLTEAPRDVVTGDGRPFQSAGSPGVPALVGLTAPRAQSSVDRDLYSLRFADSDAAMRGRFSSEGPTGIALTVELGFVDTQAQLIGELLDVYKGQSSAFNWHFDDGGYILDVSFTGQLVQLASANLRSTTPDSQHRIDSSDTSMRFVHDSVRDSVIGWGRK